MFLDIVFLKFEFTQILVNYVRCDGVFGFFSVEQRLYAIAGWINNGPLNFTKKNWNEQAA